MEKIIRQTMCIMLMLAVTACGSGGKQERIPPYSPFDDDVAFLKKYGDVIELTDGKGKSKIAVVPGLQARVMTSTAGPPGNLSYGWINRALFESGDTSIHMNAFGGEERFWLGPEGGQFSIFFQKDSAFTFENWRTPRLIDLDAYELVSQTPQSATFTRAATLTNYSGTVFSIRINREIKVLNPSEAFQLLGVTPDPNLTSVAYQSINTLGNRGETAWSKES